MKIMLGLLMMLAIACTDHGLPSNGGTCLGSDNCVCPSGETCTQTCTPGAAECHVQGGGDPVDVTCNANAECHVECNAAASCDVECGGSTSCHVTCPATGCTVTGCVGAACVVSCGAVGEATRSGTTATCP